MEIYNQLDHNTKKEIDAYCKWIDRRPWVDWKIRWNRVNQAYKTSVYPRPFFPGHEVITILTVMTGITAWYNWRDYERASLWIYTKYQEQGPRIPKRYVFTNSKAQLKQLLRQERGEC